MKLKFYKIADYDVVSRYLAGKLLAALDSQQKILWLVPGGSAIPVAVRTSHLLSPHDLTNLTIGLTDERYGPVGHVDSNRRQLIDAGFTGGDASLIEVLDGEDIKTTTARYADRLALALEKADFTIGLFGLGVDGHTAGLKAGSSAIQSHELVAHFTDSVYRRITLTPMAITLLHEVVLFAVGTEKRNQIKRLITKLGVSEQPAQILKTVESLVIFNDQIGEDYANNY